jgi:hypothetical protein
VNHADGPCDPRVAVWLALSDLYLDTEITPLHEPIARALAASPFPVRELERILWQEVHPVLRANLASVAGEWAGFDPDRLTSLIRARQARRRPWHRWTDRLGRDHVLPEWTRVRARLLALRGP